MNFFNQVYQLRRKGPLSVQRLWFLQICQIWLHALCQTVLRCGSDWKWRRQEKSQHTVFQIFIQAPFADKYHCCFWPFIWPYTLKCVFIFAGCDKHQHPSGKSRSCLPPADGSPTVNACICMLDSQGLTTCGIGQGRQCSASQAVASTRLQKPSLATWISPLWQGRSLSFCIRSRSIDEIKLGLLSTNGLGCQTGLLERGWTLGEPPVRGAEQVWVYLEDAPHPKSKPRMVLFFIGFTVYGHHNL